MTARFVGKVALVTGGGSGIGRAAAEAFAREGAQVCVAGRNEQRLKETVAAIEAAGGTAAHVTADVADATDVEAMVTAAVELYGRIDIAFNNAGMTLVDRIVDVRQEDWDRLVATNLTGVWQCMRNEILQMRRQGAGVIVNTASNAGTHITMPTLGAYGATKAAATALTAAAAKEHIGEGIRINAISPGPIRTELLREPGDSDADIDARYVPMIPLGRIGSAEEAAAAVLWLASDDSAYTVGQDLVLDGGITA
ncbi:short-chain dehydrogenase [Streptomyces sp. SA15]|uniref:SDR family NAD(P)-dependent oxidoreductase n=1 Tax=Streptomyces sp. SA15 TaxID=934019 RepID=UPI000BB03ADC|nr:glucose 1-dehydrogenase [Streptomyces sp. SA15]PAZ15849.1 short-chain dehydrogenase [Streptomyces sp. SA15]